MESGGELVLLSAIGVCTLEKGTDLLFDKTWRPASFQLSGVPAFLGRPPSFIECLSGNP